VYVQHERQAYSALKASGKTCRIAFRSLDFPIDRLDGFPPYSVFEFAASTSRAATEARGNKYMSENITGRHTSA